MTEFQGREAPPDEVERVSLAAEPFIHALMGLPGQLGLHVLCYTAAFMVMNSHTTIPKVEVWDHVAATIRKTIEENVKPGTRRKEAK